MLSILCSREYSVHVHDTRRAKCTLYTKSNLYLENLTKTYTDLHCISTIVSKRSKLLRREAFGFVLLYIVSTLWLIDIWIDPSV